MPEPGRPELVVQYVQRLPEIEYVWDSADPTVEGWPAVGQQVVWRAHVKNWGDTAATADYVWALDGADVLTGSLTVDAAEVVTVDFPWTWTFDRHELVFEVDRADAVPEESETNNRVLTHTDALSVAFYVEESAYGVFRAKRPDLNDGIVSFDDWGQFHIRRLNGIFAAAVYPETPNGVLDRVRLDRIIVVPNGEFQTVARPIAREDRTFDLVWGWSNDQVRDWTDGEPPYDPPFGYHGALLHELGHARYLLDVYRWNLDHGFRGDFVAIEEGGAPVATSVYMPALTNFVDGGWRLYETPERGLMNEEYEYVDRYSAIALNLIAGHRATRGNYNAPEILGVFLRRDVPEENRLIVRDADGTPLPFASVEVYRSGFHLDYGRYYDDVPELNLTADALGAVDLGPDPFTTQIECPPEILECPIEYTMTLIVRVEHEGRVGYGFFESRLANLAFWQGDTAVAEYDVRVDLHDP